MDFAPLVHPFLRILNETQNAKEKCIFSPTFNRTPRTNLLPKSLVVKRGFV